MTEPLKCPIVFEKNTNPCTGGICLCGKPGVHVLLNDGKVSCGWCRECLLKWFTVHSKEPVEPIA